MKHYLIVLKRYAQFSGRADRSEYWYFVLFNIIFAVSAMLLDNLLGLNFPGLPPYGIFYTIYALALLIPGLAVAVRRLHDVNKSGWYLLVALIPIAGAIWLLVLLASKGTHGDNTYGPDPNGEITFDFENQRA